jgi:hypothetical protein
VDQARGRDRPGALAARARPDRRPVRRVQRGPPGRGRRLPQRRRARPRPVGAGAAAAHRHRGPGQRRPSRLDAARGARQLLVLPAALRRHARGPGLGLPPPPRRLPPGPGRSGPGQRDGPGRLHPAADGPAADAAWLRRHAGLDLGRGLVGRGCQRAARAGRPHQPAGRDAVAARRLGGLGGLGRRHAQQPALGPGPRGGLPDRHHAGRRRHGEPLPARRGGRRRRGRGRDPAVGPALAAAPDRPRAGRHRARR